jgi:hypothetical protein
MLILQNVIQHRRLSELRCSLGFRVSIQYKLKLYYNYLIYYNLRFQETIKFCPALRLTWIGFILEIKVMGRCYYDELH